jgi:DNA (cytosine-5)-methyltransferase 1
MKYFSVYSGIAGFEKGIEDAEQSIEGNRQQQTNTASTRCGNSIIPEVSEPRQSTLRGNNSHWQCIGYSEIDRYASAIYRYHFSEQRNYGDATKIVPEGLPDFDCIVGGFPCQSFSIAGQRGGLSDTRGTLFFEIARIAGVKKPAYLWLENVKGLLSAPYTEAVQEWDEEDFDETGEPTAKSLKKHKAISGTKGWVFLTILYSLWELGYDCQWQVLNSKYHGVPQNRERVFIIGHLRGQSRPQVFPLREDDEGITEGTSEASTVRTLQGGGHSGGHHSGMTLLQLGLVGDKDNMGQRIYDTNGISCSLRSIGGGQGAKTGLYQVNTSKESGGKQPYQQNRVYNSDGLSPAINANLSEMYKVQVASAVLTPDREKRQQGRRSKNPNEPMFTLTGQDIHGVEIANAVDPDGYLRKGQRPRDNNGKPQLLPIGYRRIRRLTPTECERLQGFPDGWTKYGLFEDGEVKEISDTQRYKCCGNAVTTNVVRDICNKFTKVLK